MKKAKQFTQPSSSKWTKYVIFREDDSLRRHLPDSDLLDGEERLRQYLRKYPVVYLKPEVGALGKGVVKISKTGSHYVLQHHTRKIRFRSAKTLFQALMRIAGGKTYIIQQGIDVIRVSRRPVDFRILMLKPEEQWEIAGIMGKKAAENMAVTNHWSGGKAITLRESLKKSGRFTDRQYDEIETRLTDLAMKVAEVFGRHFPEKRELGLDVAIDRGGNLWLIEANTKPMFNLFKHHEDKGLYRKLCRTIRKLRIGK